VTGERSNVVCRTRQPPHPLRRHRTQIALRGGSDGVARRSGTEGAERRRSEGERVETEREEKEEGVP